MFYWLETRRVFGYCVAFGRYFDIRRKLHVNALDAVNEPGMVTDTAELSCDVI